MKRIHKPTVKDVAQRAGVSPSTVSRVISNNPRISRATREKVLQEMERLHFQPNAIARSLARSRTGILGIVLPARGADPLVNPFFPEALRGIVHAASDFGYDVLLSASGRHGRDELDIVRNFIGGGKVDGLILMSSRADDPNIRYLQKLDFPFTVIGSGSGLNVNHVDNDNVAAACELTRHILDTGCRRIWFVSGPPDLNVTRERQAGWMKALREAGIAPEESMTFNGDFDEETGWRLVESISQSPEKPDAILATDDLIAFGLARALMTRGYRIPEDVAIGSFNNSALSRYTEIQLTSVDINAYELGARCVEQLKAAVEEGLRNGCTIIDHCLIKRRTTLG